MKRILYIWIVLIALLFSACGGGGESSGVDDSLTPTGNHDSSPTPTQNNEDDGKKEEIATKGTQMQVGKSYTMQKGQTIIKESTTAQVALETQYKTGKTTATLLRGKARIE